MPCWYYDKRDLHYTPSYADGIDPDTESRYRREGARFIIDCGTKLGLRYDSCGTGVIYYHRFYMFHSFREFHRFVTAACCLFLAGKVEETPKKCKDIIKVTRSMLTDAQFSVFGDDPKEEVMMMERILLQTIKFDLQVSHPYTILLKYAKFIRGDKDKVNKMIQMAWTFINDSLCTTLCLQWEPDIISVALLYLASRLSKYDITDWVGKVPGSSKKWYQYLVEDANKELLEDICHQVLDLYSAPQKAPSGDVSPPPPPRQPPSGGSTPKKKHKHDRGDQDQQGQSSSKVAKSEPSQTQKQAPPEQKRPSKGSKSKSSSSKSKPPPPPPTAAAAIAASKQPPPAVSNPPTTSQPEQQSYQGQYSASDFSQHNPYMPTQMYSSSFMSQEGAQSIQTLIGGAPPQQTQQYPANMNAYGQPPPVSQPQPYQNSQPPAGYQQAYTQSGQAYQYQQQAYQQAGFTQGQFQQAPPPQFAPPFTGAPQPGQLPDITQPPPAGPFSHPPPPPPQQYQQQFQNNQSGPPQNYPVPGQFPMNFNHPPPAIPSSTIPRQAQPAPTPPSTAQQPSGNLATVRITGRQQPPPPVGLPPRR